jgi:hypothetical protein
MNKKFSQNVLFIALQVAAFNVYAQTYLSPHGTSGFGMIPSATLIPKGSVVVGNGNSIPGAVQEKGYNTQVGFGLFENIEVVARLATQNLKCDMFKSGACPDATIRDFSGSFKLGLPSSWLKENEAAIAIGASDIGGAASYFKSYYVVAGKNLGDAKLTLGTSKNSAIYPFMSGNFYGIDYRLNDRVQLGFQNIGGQTWATFGLSSLLTSNGVGATLAINQRLDDKTAPNKTSVSWTVSVPLDRSVNPHLKISTTSSSVQIVESKNFQKEALFTQLNDSGFYNSKIGLSTNGENIVEVDGGSYAWNILDAAGVALGVVSRTFASPNTDNKIKLIVTIRGIPQLEISGESLCIKRWLEKAEACEKLQIRSLLHNLQSHDNSNTVEYSTGVAWNFRPELIVSPAINSTIGTEAGAFDMDLGANINLVLPIWPGATFEQNRLEPLGVGTRGFETGGFFYGSRIKAVTNRSLIHQLISLPNLNTQLRFSAGRAHTTWDGRQIETSTQSNSGRHKLGLISGEFKNDIAFGGAEKNYHLVNYRYAYDDQQRTVTELTSGKFWAGDKGWNIMQKFWHGDTAISVYMRRSRMSDTRPLVSFAGLQISLPFTPRVNKSFEYFNLRGSNQWSYTIETKILEKDNFIVGGYGEVPKIGESLVQTFNRDRNSTKYYEASLIRLRGAFLNSEGY